MLRPKAVSAYISDQSIVGDDMIEQIEQMMDENGDVADMRDTIYKYATECMFIVYSAPCCSSSPISLQRILYFFGQLNHIFCQHL